MNNLPKFKLAEANVFSRAIKTRMPFRFGRSTMTQMPILHLQLKVTADSNTTIIGASACGIPPLWFDKAAGKTHEDNIHDLSLSLKLALDQYLLMEKNSVWKLHQLAEPLIRKKAAALGLNELTAGFGIALVDSALIDAACRHTGVAFHAALKNNLLGYGNEFSALLPNTPLEKIALRHTVGLADPITRADVSEPIKDGLPETLEEVVAETGAKFFKIKISGERVVSHERLKAIARILDTQAGDYQTSLDGNEQFHTMDEFADFLEFVKTDRALQNFWMRTLWIEQPVARGYSLVDEVSAPLKVVKQFKPVIIDESDGSDETFDRALSLGYHGISAKNCKGVFRTLHSYKRIQEIKAEGKIPPILSSEDLTNAPILPLQQDLCVAAALGINHSERNGHHYIVGFDFLTEKERKDALAEFPSLYRARSKGNAVLRIEDGYISMKEINAYGFGSRSLPDFENLTPVNLPPVPEQLILMNEGVKS